MSVIVGVSQEQNIFMEMLNLNKSKTAPSCILVLNKTDPLLSQEYLEVTLGDQSRMWCLVTGHSIFSRWGEVKHVNVLLKKFFIV